MNDYEGEVRKRNPRETSNIFSLLTFAYITGVYKKAFKKDLEDDDLYEVLRCCKSEICGRRLENQWLREKELKQKGEKPISVAKIMWRMWGTRYLFLGFVDFSVTTFSSIVQPYALSQLIGYFTPGQTTISQTEAYIFAIVVLILSMAKVVYMHNYYMWGQTFGMEIKTAFSSLLYRKALKLTPGALAETSLGNILTLITKDVQILRLSIWIFNDMWVATSQVIIICILLYIKVGLVSFVGIGVVLTIIPIQAFISKYVMSLRLQTSKKTDERLELMQEILSTMRIIKMYTWEAFFAKKIVFARRKEVMKMLLLVFFRAVLILIGAIFCKIGFYALIIACIWYRVSTDPSVIFYAVSNFKDLNIWLGQSLPYTLGQAGDFFSAFSRISKTLEAEEMDTIVRDDEITDEPLVQLKQATVKIQKQRVLNDVSLKITSGLTLITGVVGSGKSSILKAILQDYPLSDGFVTTRGGISYASQEPWLFPSSIKQNILFGEEYNERRYREVVRVCALLYDFNLFEKGDETIVSDRGLNLSKGQQARINLARAIYRDNQIYLLDDCLTALDTAVQEYIFKNCIKTFLKDKICILVSQTASHLREADKIIIMEEGSIKYIGAPNERKLKEANETATEVDDINIKENESYENNYTEKTGLIETEQMTTRKKIYQEVKKKGSVDYSVYGKYIMYGGGFFLLLLTIASGGVSQFTLSYADKLFSKWVDKKQNVLSLETNYSYVNGVSTLNYTALNEAQTAESDTFKLYSAMLFTSAGLQLLSTFMVVNFCRRASITIHKEMINRIFNAVMSFFDTHFIGNVLNRFSQDLVNIDELLPYAMNECSGAIFTITGNLVLIMSVNLKFGIYILIMVVTLIILRRIYLPAGRSLKRLEAATRSPMLGHLNATLEGLTTIRACKVEDILIEEYDRHQDLYTSAHYISTCSNRALGFFMDSVCTSLVVVVVVHYVFFDSDATAGDIGLALTQVLGLGRTLQWGIREWAELENLMTSTERLLEYTEIKVEGKWRAAIENWPTNGAITYEEVFLSYYNSDDYVLRNLNFSVKPKEKIGIVGRTGAGKSSIISTIFRLYEVQGKIIIDGIDIKTLPLDTLRRNIAIIPQDPILFSGSIRTNLDPLDEFEEKSLWSALETVGMKNTITSLNQSISGSSLNFSSGQKQLICLARAILRKTKIVVMDEATANIDPETDKIIYNIIKKNFSNSTVFMIAHRLYSVLDCDKVMVLSRGEIQEFDKPKILLDDKESLFYKMVKQADLLSYSESTYL